MRYTKSIKKEYLFKKVLTNGKYVSLQYIAVHVVPNLNINAKYNLLGICVSKKHGNSVTRNKLKRWARETFKELELVLKKGYIIVVVYKKNIKEQLEKCDINFHTVKSEIEIALTKMGVKGTQNDESI